MGKRVLMTAGLLFAFAAFGISQDQNTNPSSASGQPSGTTVSGRQTDTTVQPKNAPVKVTPAVVRDAQQKLDQAGYNPGPADGVIGPKTRAALQKYQADKQLPETGRLDQKTMAALNVGGANTVASAPKDLGRGGKAIGHDVKGGHPVEAAKAGEKSGKNFGKKVGEGSKSLAIKAKDKVGAGMSAVGKKVTGVGEKTKNAGEDTGNNQSTGNDQQPQR